jgi:hypothetical protein
MPSKNAGIHAGVRHYVYVSLRSGGNLSLFFVPICFGVAMTGVLLTVLAILFALCLAFVDSQ